MTAFTVLALHELGHAGGDVDCRTAALARLQQALGAARWLESSAELDFVVGPIPDVWSTCCRPVADRFALSLYPWLECAPMRHPDDQRTADLLARLHAVAPRMPSGLGVFTALVGGREAPVAEPGQFGASGAVPASPAVEEHIQ